MFQIVKTRGFEVKRVNAYYVKTVPSRRELSGWRLNPWVRVAQLIGYFIDAYAQD